MEVKICIQLHLYLSAKFPELLRKLTEVFGSIPAVSSKKVVLQSLRATLREKKNMNSGWGNVHHEP